MMAFPTYRFYFLDIFENRGQQVALGNPGMFLNGEGRLVHYYFLNEVYDYQAMWVAHFTTL